MLKIFDVTFNDGGWHSGSLPKYTTIAETKEEAIFKINKETKDRYKTWDCWATEVTFPGYIIEIHDKSSYERNKNIEKLIENA